MFGGEALSENNIESKVTKCLEDIIVNLGYELYDVKYEKEGKDYYLRIIIDKPEGIDINDGLAKKNFVNKLIENDVDEKHEELNKSLDLSDITGVVYRGDNSFMDEEEELNDDDENNNKKKKKKKNTNNKEISEDNDNSDSNMYNIDESMENIDKNKNKKRTATKKGKSQKK